MENFIQLENFFFDICAASFKKVTHITVWVCLFFNSRKRLNGAGKNRDRLLSIPCIFYSNLH